MDAAAAAYLDPCISVPVCEAIKHKHMVQAVEVADSRLPVEQEGALIHLVVGRARGGGGPPETAKKEQQTQTQGWNASGSMHAAACRRAAPDSNCC